jgi:hypothetical protein
VTAPLFELPLPSVLLTPEELAEITGARRSADQLAWLRENGWVYALSKRGDPRVGRLYANLRLAGINPASLTPGAGRGPNLAAVK